MRLRAFRSMLAGFLLWGVSCLGVQLPGDLEPIIVSNRKENLTPTDERLPFERGKFVSPIDETQQLDQLHRFLMESQGEQRMEFLLVTCPNESEPLYVPIGKATVEALLSHAPTVYHFGVIATRPCSIHVPVALNDFLFRNYARLSHPLKFDILEYAVLSGITLDPKRSPINWADAKSVPFGRQIKAPPEAPGKYSYTDGSTVQLAGGGCGPASFLIVNPSTALWLKGLISPALLKLWEELGVFKSWNQATRIGLPRGSAGCSNRHLLKKLYTGVETISDFKGLLQTLTFKDVLSFVALIDSVTGGTAKEHVPNSYLKIIFNHSPLPTNELIAHNSQLSIALGVLFQRRKFLLLSYLLQPNWSAARARLGLLNGRLIRPSATISGYLRRTVQLAKFTRKIFDRKLTIEGIPSNCTLDEIFDVLDVLQIADRDYVHVQNAIFIEAQLYPAQFYAHGAQFPPAESLIRFLGPGSLRALSARTRFSLYKATMAKATVEIPAIIKSRCGWCSRAVVPRYFCNRLDSSQEPHAFHYGCIAQNRSKRCPKCG